MKKIPQPLFTRDEFRLIGFIIAEVEPILGGEQVEGLVSGMHRVFLVESKHLGPTGATPRCRQVPLLQASRGNDFRQPIMEARAVGGYNALSGCGAHRDRVRHSCRGAGIGRFTVPRCHVPPVE